MTWLLFGLISLGVALSPLHCQHVFLFAKLRNLFQGVPAGFTLKTLARCAHQGRVDVEWEHLLWGPAGPIPCSHPHTSWRDAIVGPEPVLLRALEESGCVRPNCLCCQIPLSCISWEAQRETQDSPDDRGTELSLQSTCCCGLKIFVRNAGLGFALTLISTVIVQPVHKYDCWVHLLLQLNRSHPSSTCRSSLLHPWCTQLGSGSRLPPVQTPCWKVRHLSRGSVPEPLLGEKMPKYRAWSVLIGCIKIRNCNNKKHDEAYGSTFAWDTKTILQFLAMGVLLLLLSEMLIQKTAWNYNTRRLIGIWKLFFLIGKCSSMSSIATAFFYRIQAKQSLQKSLAYKQQMMRELFHM